MLEHILSESKAVFKGENLKNRLSGNGVAIGSWLGLGRPEIAEILADAGFEFLVVDLEHSAITIREAEDLIRVIDLKNITPLVRLTANDPAQIKRVMDAGAAGVIVPVVQTRQQAAEAVAAVKYPPAGARGVGLARAQGYGPGFAQYAATINERSIVIAQIEDKEGIANLEAILSVEGIDGTMIGPYDLSASVGKAGTFGDPEVTALLTRYEEVSRRVGKPMGFHVIAPDHREVAEKLARGYTFLVFSVDFLFLGQSARTELCALRSSLERARGRPS